MKHSFNQRSSVAPRRNRQFQQQKKQAIAVGWKFLFRVLLLGLLVLIVGGIGLGILNALGGSKHNGVLLFKYINSDGSVNKNTIAYQNEKTGKLHLFHLNFSPVTERLTDPDERYVDSLLLGVLIDEVIVLSMEDGVVIAEDNAAEVVAEATTALNRRSLQASLWRSLRQESVLSRSFWKYLDWWLRVRALTGATFQERRFDSLDQWQQYQLHGEVQVSDSTCSIAVVNTTAVTGLANQVGKVLERSGLFVARQTSNQTNVSQSLLLQAQAGACGEVVNVLRRLTPYSTSVAVEPTAAQRYRADIVLLVGNDAATTLDHHQMHCPDQDHPSSAPCLHQY